MLEQSEDFTVCYSTHTVMFFLAILCFAQGAEIVTKKIWRDRCRRKGWEVTPPPGRLILAVYATTAILMFTVFTQAGYTPVWGG